MATNSTSNQPVQPENEIDLIEVVKKLWTKRKFIIKVTVIWACLGVLVALFSAKEFSADCTIVPQTGDKTAGGNLGGLAAMAGINFGVISEGDVLSPKIYPKILASVPFQKEIMQTEIKFEDYEHPVKLFDYFMNEDYQKFSLIGTAIKYTIGLPGLIISAIRGEEPEPEYGGGVASSLQILSKDESECMKILNDKISMNLNEKDGYITITVYMPEPLAAAQLAFKVQMLLQQYVTDFKIEKVKANMVFIDPPYNVKIQGHVCGAGQTKHKEFSFGSGEMNEAEFISFLKTSMANIAKYSAENSIHYICMDWRHISELLSASRDIYPQMLNMVVWCKKNGGMGSFYRSQHELIFVFQNGKGSHVNNVELGKHGRYRTNVWHYAGVNSFGSEQKNLKMHPTVKPVELVRDAILDASKRGDIVLDAFLGSGTTLIAAEKAGRVCYGIEYEPLYIDTIIRRYHELTGNWAIHLSSQKSYEQLLQEKLEKINE